MTQKDYQDHVRHRNTLINMILLMLCDLYSGSAQVDRIHLRELIKEFTNEPDIQ